MKASAFKYFLVFTCLFAILERTGIADTLLLNFREHGVTKWHQPNDAEEDESRPNETKEVELKEYWAITHGLLTLPALILSAAVRYHPYQHSGHNGWISPVPTPPPSLV